MYKNILNLKSESAKALYNYVRTNHDNMYFGFSKNTKWDATDTIPHLLENKNYKADILKNLLLLYKFDRNALSMCFTRVNWVKNTVLTQYNSDDTSLKCYVITKDYAVYKCLSNGNGSQSLYEPNHITFNAKDYADGYRWKYLYTLSTLEKKAFLSTTKVPISIDPPVNSIQHLTEFNAVPGTVETFDILNGGSDYTAAASITINGDGTGARAKLFIQNGQVKGVTVVSPGMNYTWATATISSPGIEANIKVHVSPLGGHGSNIFEELNASSLMLNSKRLNGSADVDFLPTTFDYRQVSLLSNIQGNKKELISMCYKVQVEDSYMYQPNDKIRLNTNIECNVVYTEVILGEHFIYLNEPTRPLVAADFLNNYIELVSDPLARTRITKILYIPTINKNFNILYTENLAKLTIVDQELDVLRIVINF